jgi:hypothetical protein
MMTKSVPKETKASANGRLRGFAMHRLPYQTYAELQRAYSDKQIVIGVDPLAAAEWSAAAGRRWNQILVQGLSLLLILAALASVIAGFAVSNYWLLLALPIQGLAFYGAHLDAPYRFWVTLAGVASLIIFLNLLLNQFPTAATLVAYAGLTFAAVRATSSLTNSSFRKALVNDEELFHEAFANRVCTIRDNKTKRVYEHQAE